MAGKIPSRGDYSISQDLLDEHEWMADALIDDLGLTCTLVFPAVASECPNCLFDLSTGRSANIYRAGGPIEFADHTVCPWCGGEGKRTENPTDEVTLRVYWGGMEVNAAIRQFQSLPAGFNSKDALLFVIGYMNDMAKFERSESLIVNNPMTTQEVRCEKVSHTAPWGFRKNRYFACILRQR